jgi:hypothetical protein
MCNIFSDCSYVINQVTSTTGMTDQSVVNYNEKLNAAKQQLKEINQILQSHPNVYLLLIHYELYLVLIEHHLHVQHIL